MLVVVYLLAVVLANLLATWFGPASTIINAFLFIGLDLTIRDRLHEKWKSQVRRNMPLLILGGSVVSFLVNHNALRIAIASCVAFGVSETIKALLYAGMKRQTHMKRVNVANVFASAVDSLIFPTVAFGAIIFWAIIGQFVAKVLGGYVWTLILNRKNGTTSVLSVND